MAGKTGILKPDEVHPYADCQIGFHQNHGATKNRPDGKYIEVTAITRLRWAKEKHTPWV